MLSARQDELEDEILTACALRFDGYKYTEVVGWDSTPVLERALCASILPETELEKCALLFVMQRILFKWGGENLPKSDPHWKIFRTLFLDVWNVRVPEEYQPEPHNDFAWPAKFNVEHSVALIRSIHAQTTYTDYIPCSEND